VIHVLVNLFYVTLPFAYYGTFNSSLERLSKRFSGWDLFWLVLGLVGMIDWSFDHWGIS
jgi:hypothetical protein